MNVLLSIKPEHVRSIISGRKRFEFRKCIFRRPGIQTVIIYSTSPVKRLVAEFDIASVLDGAPDAIWRLTESASGISKDYFDSYFHGRRTAYAIGIGHLRIYENAVDPLEKFGDFVAPQSFMYVPDS